MGPLAQLYLFLVGLAAGLAILAATAYRRISPVWLRGVLLGCAVLMLGRYVALAAHTSPEAAERWAFLRRFWFASVIGLTLPSVIAVDQLVKHPAMTPKRLLRWCAPWLAVQAALLLFAPLRLVPDSIGAWAVRMDAPWRWVLSATQALFVLGFLFLCLKLLRLLPAGPGRRALAALAAAQAWLGLDGVVLALGGSYFRPYLFSEMAVLLALWYAYETTARP